MDFVTSAAKKLNMLVCSPLKWMLIRMHNTFKALLTNALSAIGNKAHMLLYSFSQTTFIFLFIKEKKRANL